MRFMESIILILALVFLIGCVQPGIDLEGNQPEVTKFGAWAFKKENKDIVVIVDTELALRRKTEKYFPLSIKVANKNLESLVLDRESFFLIDENGKRYGLAAVDEIEQNYDKLTPDHKFKSQTGLMADQLQTGFELYQKADSNFFPQTQGAARVIDVVYIRWKGFMEDLIYFPMPDGGIEGKTLRIELDAVELKDPIDIPFLVK